MSKKNLSITHVGEGSFIRHPKVMGQVSQVTSFHGVTGVVVTPTKENNVAGLHYFSREICISLESGSRVVVTLFGPHLRND